MVSNVKQVKRDSNYTLIGGVRFNKKDVKVDDNGFIIFDKNIVCDSNSGTGYMQYTVKMNDGTCISYREQKQTNGAKISTAGNGSIHFQNIDGATITDTPNNDKYDFCKCKNVIVNAKREREEMQIVSAPSITGAYSYSYPTSIATDKDTISSVFCENMQVNYTKGYDTYLQNGSVFLDSDKL